MAAAVSPDMVSFLAAASSLGEGAAVSPAMQALGAACLYVPLGVVLAVIVMDLFSGDRQGVDLDKAAVVLLVMASVLFFLGSFLTFSQASVWGQQAAVRAAGMGVVLGLASAVAAMLKQQCYLQKLMRLARPGVRRRHASTPAFCQFFYLLVLIGMLGGAAGMAWFRPQWTLAGVIQTSPSPTLIDVEGASELGIDTVETSPDPLAVVTGNEDVLRDQGSKGDSGQTMTGGPDAWKGPAMGAGSDALASLEETTVENTDRVEVVEESGMGEGGAASGEMAATAEESTSVEVPEPASSAGGETASVTTPTSRPREMDPGALRVFKGSVMPMLRDRCVSCHGAEKQKGGLRLDDPSWIRKGGNSGPVVAVFEPQKSFIYTSTTLPPDDPDIMPAKGSPLTSAQTSALRRWILGGAPMGDGRDAEAIAAAASLAGGSGSPGGGENVSLEGSVAQALEAAHILVEPRENGMLEIDGSMTRNYPETELDLGILRPVAERVVSLDLSRTKIADDDLAPLSDMVQLRELLLSRTKVGDAGLAHVEGLKALEIINLYGTEVSDAGLQSLEGLENLKKVYLWNSKATPAGAERLRKAIPGVEVNVGQ